MTEKKPASVEEFVTHVDGVPGPVAFTAREAASHARALQNAGHTVDIKVNGVTHEKAMEILRSPRKTANNGSNGKELNYELQRALARLSNTVQSLTKSCLRKTPSQKEREQLEGEYNAVCDILLGESEPVEA